MTATPSEVKARASTACGGCPCDATRSIYHDANRNEGAISAPTSRAWQAITEYLDFQADQKRRKKKLQQFMLPQILERKGNWR